MSTTTKPPNPTIVIIDGLNNADNIIFGASSGTVSGDITTSYELFGGAHGYNELVGDADFLSDYQQTVGNLLIGGDYSTNLMIGTAYTADSSKPGPNTGILTIGSNTIRGGANSTNTAYGDAYDFTVYGVGGHNALYGGVNSTNTMAGDAYFMDDFVTGGNNTLVGGANYLNTLAGDAMTMNGPVSGGHNHVTGGANAYNVLFGAAQAMTGGSSTTANVVTGGADSTNYEYGDAQTITNSTGGGNTVTGGGAGSTDYLYGDAQTASYGANVAYGGGNTVVAGSGSVSYMWGSGTDGDRFNASNTFVFAKGDNLAYIEDFRAVGTLASFTDTIDLKGFANLSAFSQLDITTSGGNSTVHLGADTLVVLNATGLFAGDFRFG